MPNVEYPTIETRLKNLGRGELRTECFRVHNWCMFNAVKIPPDEIESIAENRVTLMSSDGFDSDLPLDSCIPQKYLDQADPDI